MVIMVIMVIMAEGSWPGDWKDSSVESRGRKDERIIFWMFLSDGLSLTV